MDQQELQARLRAMGPGVFLAVLHIDGRNFDLTGLTVEEAVAGLQAAGVSPKDVAATVHVLRDADLGKRRPRP